MIQRFSAPRLQSSLGVLQIMGILGAWFFGMISNKMLNYDTNEEQWFGLATFIRHGAILLTIIPVIWVVWTIRKEDGTSHWTQRHSLISGIILGIALTILAGMASKIGKNPPRLRVIPISGISERQAMPSKTSFRKLLA
ncbi:MAG: hypothetical protein ACN4GG_00950 [Akkermansiaceae bacterium]